MNPIQKVELTPDEIADLKIIVLELEKKMKQRAFSANEMKSLNRCLSTIKNILNKIPGHGQTI